MNRLARLFGMVAIALALGGVPAQADAPGLKRKPLGQTPSHRRDPA